MPPFFVVAFAGATMYAAYRVGRALAAPSSKAGDDRVKAEPTLRGELVADPETGIYRPRAS